MDEKEFLKNLTEKIKQYGKSGGNDENNNMSIVPADVIQFKRWCEKNSNSIKNRKIDNCGENYAEITPAINLKDIVVGKRFQFDGDINRVREVIEIEEKIVLVKTVGCTEDFPYYKIHYSQLKINETQIEEYK